MFHDFYYLHEVVYKIHFFTHEIIRTATKINLDFPSNNYIHTYIYNRGSTVFWKFEEIQMESPQIVGVSCHVLRFLILLIKQLKNIPLLLSKINLETIILSKVNQVQKEENGCFHSFMAISFETEDTCVSLKIPIEDAILLKTSERVFHGRSITHCYEIFAGICRAIFWLGSKSSVKERN